MDELLPIGRFARICRLTIKALRHYDELGLLQPARVDAGSGYRHYRRSQVRDALAISLLRSLDVPLASIREVLAGAQPRSVLGPEVQRVKRELALRAEQLLALERVVQENRVLPYEAALRDEPARSVWMLRDTIEPERHVEATLALVAELESALTAAGIAPSSEVMCLLPDAPALDGWDVRVCCDVRESAAPAGRIVCEQWPAGRVAFVTHHGAYEQLGLAEHALLAWVQERAYTPCGAMREIYISDPRAVAVSELTTELALPLAPS